MPRGDGTGPMGMGPMTGRRAGYCAGYSGPGFANPFFGGGYFGPRMGRGGGRGFRLREWFSAAGVPFRGSVDPFARWPQGGQAPFAAQPMNREAEIDMLKAEAADLENALKEISERLARLSEEK
jgi:hypothetical protein